MRGQLGISWLRVFAKALSDFIIFSLTIKTISTKIMFFDKMKHFWLLKSQNAELFSLGRCSRCGCGAGYVRVLRRKEVAREQMASSRHTYSWAHVCHYVIPWEILYFSAFISLYGHQIEQSEGLLSKLCCYKIKNIWKPSLHTLDFSSLK